MTPPMTSSDTESGFALRPVIERSWKRSSACGLRQGFDVDLPYDQDFDDDSRLIRAARPVLDRLVSTMSDTHHSVILADRDARLIQRWVGTEALGGRLDNAHVAPGFGFPEEFAGTNGVGTALEEAKVVAVHGEEHYAEFLQNFSCVGVPIHDPIKGGVEGILDFTCLTKDYSPLMPPLLVEVAKHIENRLSHQASATEVALVDRFIRTCRSLRGAVVALRPNFFLANAAASAHLGPTDQAVLWDTATTLAAMGRDDGSVDLAGGRYRIRLTTVDAGARSDPGMVIRLAPERPTTGTSHDVRPAAAPGGRQIVPSLPGRSPQWKIVQERAQFLADSDQPVAITGETGTGKLHVAKHLHRLSMTKAGVRLFDSAVDGRSDHSHLLDRCHEALRFGDTVIVRRIDLLPPAVLSELGELVRHRITPGRLIVTCNDAAPEAAERALAAYPHHVWLPPLRQRTEDIADLVPALLAELAPDRAATCALPVVQVLMRYPWPGNTTELRDVLATALVAAGHGEIELAHVPVWIVKRAHRRQFTPIEQSERDLIIEILASVDNNRTEAAKILGIGRATLYRKLRSLGISTGQELIR